MRTTTVSLLAYALTGERLAIDEGEKAGDELDATEVLDRLRRAGWPKERIQAQAHQLWDQDQPWPHLVGPGDFGEIGAAQWYALLTQLRTALGLDTMPQPPSRRTTLSPDERRLLAEVPPHHGKVG